MTQTTIWDILGYPDNIETGDVGDIAPTQCEHPITGNLIND